MNIAMELRNRIESFDPRLVTKYSDLEDISDNTIGLAPIAINLRKTHWNSKCSNLYLGFFFYIFSTFYLFFCITKLKISFEDVLPFFLDFKQVLGISFFSLSNIWQFYYCNGAIFPNNN